MVSAHLDDLVDSFLARRGHRQSQTWDESYNKKQCPECGGLHKRSAHECTVCGWPGPDAD